MPAQSLYLNKLTKTSDVDIVRQTTDLPILIGSGASPENIDKVYEKVDEFIVGSYFKKDGKGKNFVEKERVKKFTDTVKQLKK